ncbi:hypothetical protein COLO4_13213 [Corchorus olitorius]|uniref:Uncharacterized protein n=1 Tax=Corchorus olitorius TaxID=93759 RepID=A0A1R3JXN3_9ROSI|nr:hypothetical protein COLO4_13213 [Corchorus olitorius]
MEIRLAKTPRKEKRENNHSEYTFPLALFPNRHNPREHS